MRFGTVVGALFAVGLAAVVTTYETVPSHNTSATHFDTIIVLGCPVDPDGKASPEERERVMEAVREFQAGRAAHIILTGGAVHNQWNEAGTMARVALGAGVPADALVVEPQARNTIQNIFYSDRIMRQHGWTSAEVVSSPSHLPRAALILKHYPFAWQTHPSHWPPEYAWKRIVPYYLYEAVGTTLLRWFGYRPSPFIPART